mmetsp:Transcript_17085/g.28382  ORF Transcript_17085/g.28382 Transcript_17085/m.28382 type:complete len:318 (+) Transcript_17085:107-1060(+)|eukprot:CAMPEP_0119022190 /NCGR_PEP_ID=MMETSP1176-20130426/27463_1 /TAXON_ID=265551 /ORGANISM="Synedropsis recta cf, Strain CCMP1620" /LENGTH=317 /DNA_ID=CAMNT_0006976955 /DNA_START=98 /DNA_END=1051 /DNA_ORIENTATION=+
MNRTFRTSVASRERNRMHARKTRQRKKEHIQILQSRANQLKEEQIRILQVINETNTASILIGLFSVGKSSSCSPEATHSNPAVEQLLRRPVEDIPDAAKIQELPALILPGQHTSKKKRPVAPPDDGIDYELLGKERGKCTPAELDQIRRERNRMHAKRTRDRKRMFMDEMEELIKKLEEENALLQEHLESIDGECPSTPPALVSPKLLPAVPLKTPTASLLNDDVSAVYASRPAAQEYTGVLRETPKQRRELVTQLKSLLVAAGAFVDEGITMSSAVTAVSTSTDASGNSSCCDDDHAPKRQRLEGPIPHSITTTCP